MPTPSLFKVFRTSAVNLLKETGYASADQYKDGLLAKKLHYLSDMTEGDCDKIKIPHLRRLITTLRRALARGDEVRIEPDRAKPAAGKAGRPKSENSIEANVVRMLSTANAADPITKRDMLAVLVERFPDRDADAMRDTLNKLVPSMLKKSGHDVRKNTAGFWIFVPERVEDNT